MTRRGPSNNPHTTRDAGGGTPARSALARPSICFCDGSTISHPDILNTSLASARDLAIVDTNPVTMSLTEIPGRPRHEGQTFSRNHPRFGAISAPVSCRMHRVSCRMHALNRNLGAIDGFLERAENRDCRLPWGTRSERSDALLPGKIQQIVDSSVHLALQPAPGQGITPLSIACIDTLRHADDGLPL